MLFRLFLNSFTRGLRCWNPFCVVYRDSGSAATEEADDGYDVTLRGIDGNCSANDAFRHFPQIVDFPVASSSSSPPKTSSPAPPGKDRRDRGPAADALADDVTAPGGRAPRIAAHVTVTVISFVFMLL